MGGASGWRRPSPPVSASSVLCAASWRRSAASADGSSACSPASRHSSSAGGGTSAGASSTEAARERTALDQHRCVYERNKEMIFLLVLNLFAVTPETEIVRQKLKCSKETNSNNIFYYKFLVVLMLIF